MLIVEMACSHLNRCCVIPIDLLNGCFLRALSHVEGSLSRLETRGISRSGDRLGCRGLHRSGGGPVGRIEGPQAPLGHEASDCPVIPVRNIHYLPRLKLALRADKGAEHHTEILLMAWHEGDWGRSRGLGRGGVLAGPVLGGEFAHYFPDEGVGVGPRAARERQHRVFTHALALGL
jgi:hypothetical protein